MISLIKRWSGLDIRSNKYSYGRDPRFGYTAASRIPDSWVKSTCGYCAVGCGMLIGVKEDRIVSIRGDENHPANKGKLCPKGLSEHYNIYADTRLKFPGMRSSKGKWFQLEWEQAYEIFLDKIKTIQNSHGADSFAVLSTGQLLTEEFYALGKLVRFGLKTGNYDGNTTLCMASAVNGYKANFGSDGPPGSFAGMEKADVVFLIGANIADNQPVLFQRLVKNKNRTIIVCDPRRTKTAAMSDIFLPVKPGKDITLLNAIMNWIIQNNLHDREYVKKYTVGFSSLKSSLKKYTPEYAEKICGISKEDIIHTAGLIGKKKNVFFAWTMGINHGVQGTETVSAVNTLALLTGNIGRTGAAPMSITGQCNAMGTREYGFASSMPGYRAFGNETHKKELAEIWNMNPDEITDIRGRAYPDIIDAVISGEIKGLWIIGTNPFVSFPDTNRLKDALSSLEFIAVQDGFADTPTTEAAHLLLPAAIWGEKDGTYTNMERRISRARAAVKPAGAAKSDFDIFLDLARKMDIADTIFPGWESPEDAFNEMRKISLGRLNDISGVTYSKLERLGGIQWPCRSIPSGGTDSLYVDGKFQTENNKAVLTFADQAELPEKAEDLYPLNLNTGRTVEHWHTGTKTAKTPILQYLSPCPYAEVHPETAKKYSVRDGDTVSVVSRRGRIDGVLIRVTEIIRKDEIFVPFHFKDARVNSLTIAAFDPISREPNYKQSAVRIEKK